MADPQPAVPRFVDEHSTAIHASRERVWEALRQYVDVALVGADHGLLGRVLGTEPRSGFEVATEDRPREIGLAGQHRFARYLLVFVLADDDGSTILTARTFADFPGPRGRVYRTLVIGSRGHVLAVRRMLAAVRRLSRGRRWRPLRDLP